MVELIRDYLPLWALPWLQAIGVGLQILLIVAGAWGLRRMLRRLVPVSYTHLRPHET